MRPKSAHCFMCTHAHENATRPICQDSIALVNAKVEEWPAVTV
jgi:hypothetical protein